MNTPQDSSYRPSARGPTTGSGAGDSTEDMAEKVRAEGQEQVQNLRNTAADKVETIADSVKAAAAEMKDDDVAHLSQHVSDMASGLSRMADGLRDKSADEILRDVRRIARENPTVFIAGSIAIGFGLTRFARASASSGTTDTTGTTGSLGSPSYASASERTGQTRWTDPDAAVAGTTARPATGNATIDTISPDGLTGTVGAVPGPSASTDEAISARTGAATSDPTTGGQDSLSSTDTLRGRNQP